MPNTTFTPVCRYCGQAAFSAAGKKFKSQDEADKYAAMNCDCPEAREAREVNSTNRSVSSGIDELVSIVIGGERARCKNKRNNEWYKTHYLHNSKDRL